MMNWTRVAGAAVIAALLGSAAAADAVRDASKALSRTGVHGKLIVFAVPTANEVEAMIGGLSPYASKVRVGVGEGSPVYGFTPRQRTELLGRFREARFRTCSGWGLMSEIVGEDDAARQGHMTLLGQGRKIGATSALIVDAKPTTNAGQQFMEDGTVAKGAGTGDDRLFVDLGTANGGEVRDDRSFAVIAALISEQILGGMDWDCMNGE